MPTRSVACEIEFRKLSYIDFGGHDTMRRGIGYEGVEVQAEAVETILEQVLTRREVGNRVGVARTKRFTGELGARTAG